MESSAGKFVQIRSCSPSRQSPRILLNVSLSPFANVWSEGLRGSGASCCRHKPRQDLANGAAGGYVVGVKDRSHSAKDHAMTRSGTVRRLTGAILAVGLF